MLNFLTTFFEPLPKAVWRDQFAHFVAGLLLTAFYAAFMQMHWALLSTAAVAGAREMLQHPLRCGPGCRTDLAFWALGALMVPLVLMLGG